MQTPYNLLRFIISVTIAVMLVSCTTPGPQEMDEDRPGFYKYDAWRLKSSVDFEAINVLVDDADKLIENNAYNSAADKLERVLRIKPDYAPAWSRLAWIALQEDSPKRSVQMAKRSNSFVRSNTELQLLNWSFIRTASQQMNDEKNYLKADQKINSLKAF